MRLRIAHTTTYRYEPPATSVIQVLRMTPGSHDGQYVADWQIDVSTDSRLDMHLDAFGNVTHVLSVGPTASLTINVEGMIETHDTGGILKGTDERFPPGFFLRTTPLTELNPAMTTFVRELRAESEADVLGFLHALMMQINEHMTFDADPTNTGTSAAEAFVLKRGVCQDYAHIFIACAPTASSTSRPAMPGRRRMCRCWDGSGSIRRTRSAPPTPMRGSRSGWIISAQHRCAARATAAAARR